MDEIIKIIIKECAVDAAKLKRFDRRTRLVKSLIKQGIELLDRKQDGCLYLKTPAGFLKIYFQETKEGHISLYSILRCTESGIPIDRKNLTKI